MRRYIGWIILGTLIFYLFGTLFPFFMTLSGFFAWLVPLLMWNSLGRNSCNQTMFLLILGFLALAFAGSHGVFLGWEQILVVNLPLLAMFVAVSFLTLTNPGIEDPYLPQGRRAVISTAIGTHLLGAAINLSVLFVFGDRLQKGGKLSREQMIILARSFCAAAWWSPFFIATGVALTYAPDMLWTETLIPGAIMSVIAIGFSTVEVCWFRKAVFSGYPLKGESLTVPLLLAGIVIAVHYFRPDFSILTLICLLAPAGTLVFMRGRPRIRILHDFIENRVSSVSSQFALFLAAGVFSSGIKSVIQVYPEVFAFQAATFTPAMFAMVSGVMIVIGILGVHPVVSIAIVSPLLLPLNPNHSQLGFLFLTSWAVSTSSSPLSGVGLALVSRFNASPKMILQSNYHYAIAMWGVACVVNILYFG